MPGKARRYVRSNLPVRYSQIMAVESREHETAMLVLLALWPTARLVIAPEWLERVRSGEFDGDGS